MIDARYDLPCDRVAPPPPPRSTINELVAASEKGPIIVWPCMKPVYSYIYPDFSPEDLFNGLEYSYFPLHLFRTSLWKTASAPTLKSLGSLDGLNLYRRTIPNSTSDKTSNVGARGIGMAAVHVCDFYGGSSDSVPDFGADHFNSGGFPVNFVMEDGSSPSDIQNYLPHMCQSFRPWYNYVFTPLSNLEITDLCPWLTDASHSKYCLVFYDHPL